MPIGTTVVIPAYNEQVRLAPTLPRVLDWLAGRGEVIVVDDGSRDSTGTLAESYGAGVIRYERNRGKGFAVRVGIAAASYERIVVTDADLASPIGEAGRLLDALEQGAEIAIGVRRRIGRNQPPHRLVLGRIYGAFVRKTLAIGVHDPQCGMKAFRRASAQKLICDCVLDGYAFDAEILSLALARGLTVAEVPVLWTDVPGTKVNVLADGTRMVWDVLGLALRHRALGGALTSGKHPTLSRADGRPSSQNGTAGLPGRRSRQPPAWSKASSPVTSEKEGSRRAKA